MSDAESTEGVSRVLVPVDGSPPSIEAVSYVKTVFNAADIILLTAIDPVDGFTGYEGDTSGNWREQAEQSAETLLETQRAEIIEEERTSGSSRTVKTLSVIGSPTDVIIQTADENDIDQIVIGSHGRRGIERIVFGSVAESVVRRTGLPVTIVR
jgi:nucleotide-binding universal stress UspA family protein